LPPPFPRTSFSLSNGEVDSSFSLYFILSTLLLEISDSFHYKSDYSSPFPVFLSCNSLVPFVTPPPRSLKTSFFLWRFCGFFSQPPPLAPRPRDLSPPPSCFSHSVYRCSSDFDPSSGSFDAAFGRWPAKRWSIRLSHILLTLTC